MARNDKPQSTDESTDKGPDSGGARQEPLSGVVVVYATFPGREAALECGRAMVEAGVAGCINVLPAMTSVYVWRGVTEVADEAVMIAKVKAENAARAVDFIAQNHSYELPAILVLPVIAGSSGYIAWLRGEARDQ